MKRENRKRPSGFTLIEVLFAAMLIGLMVAAIAVSSGASTMVNAVSVDLSTAEFLTEEVREMTRTVEFSDLLAYDAVTYSPPVDLSGTSMSEFSTFSQQISVEYVNPSDFETPVTGPTDFVRVTVTVTKNNIDISSTSWIRTNL